jgi:hypothetical protein
MPDFAILNGDGSRSTLDHIGQFITEYGEASFINNCKLRFFPLSLSAVAFTWSISLLPDLVYIFSNLQHKFHDYFLQAELS